MCFCPNIIGKLAEKKSPNFTQIILLTCVGRSFCPTWPHSHPCTNKHREPYFNYKLFGLLLRLITNYLLQLKLIHNSYYTMWLVIFYQYDIIILLPLHLAGDYVSAFLLPTVLLLCLYFLLGY